MIYESKITKEEFTEFCKKYFRDKNGEINISKAAYSLDITRDDVRCFINGVNRRGKKVEIRPRIALICAGYDYLHGHKPLLEAPPRGINSAPLNKGLEEELRKLWADPDGPTASEIAIKAGKTIPYLQRKFGPRDIWWDEKIDGIPVTKKQKNICLSARRGEKIQEIAARMNVSVKTIRAQLAQIKKRGISI